MPNDLPDYLIKLSKQNTDAIPVVSESVDRLVSIIDQQVTITDVHVVTTGGHPTKWGTAKWSSFTWG